MVSTRKKKHQDKKQLSLLNKTLNVFAIGTITNIKSIGNESLEAQTNGLSNNFWRVTVGENSASQDQVIEKYWREN